MNSWFTVKTRYTKQMDDGTFKRVTEPYLVAAMTFTDAEARIYEELGALIRGEFIVTGIARTEVHDIFHYEDSDVWYKCKVAFESGDGGEEGSRSKKVSQIFLVSAHSVKEAYERLHESLGGMLIDFQTPVISVSPIVDIFPFGDDGEDLVAVEFERQLKKEVAQHAMNRGDYLSNLSDIVNIENLFEEAAQLVVKRQKADVSLIQRHFKMGIKSAQMVLQHLKDKGVISEFDDFAGKVNFVDENQLKSFIEQAE